MKNRTFAIIKPDAIKNKYTGLIYDKILKANFKILSCKLIKITKMQAQHFYLIHKDKPFYNELTDFMSSGQSMVMVLEKNNAVEEWRILMGATNPEDANKGTIRKDFASSIGENAVHGSDSDENADLEIKFFFTESELI